MQTENASTIESEQIVTHTPTSSVEARRAATDYADPHWNESLCRLLIGDYAKGCEKYE